MSDESPSTEQVATQYIDAQLEKARAALRSTRIFSIVILLVVGGYFTFLTGYIRKQYLEPKAAAGAATDYAVLLVQDNGPQLVEKLMKDIPEIIRKSPDYVIQSLPKFREDLETTLEAHFEEYCRASSRELGAHLDTFIEENKEGIGDFLEAGQTAEGAKELAAALEEEIRLYLEEPGEDGESIKQKLDESLQMLRNIESRLGRLAANKDLTPQEAQLRHAIAVIMHTAEKEVPKLAK